MPNYISQLDGRYLYWKGSKLPVSASGNELRVDIGCESRRVIQLSSHSLFLPFHVFSYPDFPIRIDSAGHFEPILQETTKLCFERYGNALLGERIGLSFHVHEGILHRPQLLPLLWRAMLKSGILFVRATLPDTSPYQSCFGPGKRCGEITLASKSQMGLHFFGVEK